MEANTKERCNTASNKTRLIVCDRAGYCIRRRCMVAIWKYHEMNPITKITRKLPTITFGSWKKGLPKSNELMITSNTGMMIMKVRHSVLFGFQGFMPQQFHFR